MFTSKNFKETYCYWVEYIEDGVKCSDWWSQKCLDEELKNGEVKITSVIHRSELDDEE